MKQLLQVLVLSFVLLISTELAATTKINVADAAGTQFTLIKPVKRIVSLSPHITELLFETEAGHLIVGTVEYSNFPDAAKKIPHVGNYSRIDLERLVALKPDMIIAWQSGNPQSMVNKIAELGFPIFYSEPRSIEQVLKEIKTFAQMAGMAEKTDKKIRVYQTKLESLKSNYQHLPRLSVFYQM